METVAVTFRGQTQTVPFGFRPLAWATPSTAACLVNGLVASLHHPLVEDTVLEFLDLADRPAHRVYRRTLSFLLEAARRLEGLGPLEAGPSWGGAHSWYRRDGQPWSPAVVGSLKTRLQALVASDTPLVPRALPWAQARQLLVDAGDAETWNDLAWGHGPTVTLVALEGLWLPAPDVLLASTGRAAVWGLEVEGDALLVSLPQKAWPLTPARWRRSPAVARAHGQDRDWSRLQGVRTVGDLNALGRSPGAVEAFVQGAEAVQERRIAALADEVVAAGSRIVLVAGPSSSGKTTFAKRLALQLGACGRRPLAVSLDDYFRNREDTPKDAEGRYDFECLGAMDLERLGADLEALLADRQVELPSFDFKTGHRRPTGRPYRLGAEGVLILEGIHGLNPELWPGRPTAVGGSMGVRSIFVSALTSLTRDDGSRISASDHRLIRRLVRDAQFRGYSAQATLGQWPSVRRGEDEHLFPFQDRADAVFNSALAYELSVLGPVAAPLLTAVEPTAPEYPQARSLLAFLEGFQPIPLRFVPAFSLLREFLGQSGFHY